MKKSGKPQYVIVRCQGAGVFAGDLVERKGTEATLTNARRLWQWAGAASLSELAVRGTSNPGGCKFPVEVPRVELTGVIEMLYATDEARESIAKVKEWTVK